MRLVPVVTLFSSIMCSTGIFLYGSTMLSVADGLSDLLSSVRGIDVPLVLVLVLVSAYFYIICKLLLYWVIV
jgi:hypothetical protein